MRPATHAYCARRLAFALALTASLLPGIALCQNEIRGHVIASGGGTVSGATHTLSTTLGQAVIGGAAGPTHSIRSGFWGASPHVTSTEPTPSATLPKVDALHPGVPNPFNPFTTIHYELAGEPTRVRLRIYDLRGQLVDTLVDEIQTPGKKHVIWQGRDDRGAPVASGTYFSVLEAHDKRHSRKLVLVK